MLPSLFHAMHPYIFIAGACAACLIRLRSVFVTFVPAAANTKDRGNSGKLGLRSAEGSRKGAASWCGSVAAVPLAICAVAFASSRTQRKAKGDKTESAAGSKAAATAEKQTSASKQDLMGGSVGMTWGMSGEFGPWPGTVGATMPLVDPSKGMDRWDPLNLSTGDVEKFDRYRGAELKHGRVAMLAVVGLIAQHSYRFPFVLTGGFGELKASSLTDVPSGFGAVFASPSAEAFGILFLVAGWFETVFWTDNGRAPGDFGDPAGLRKRSMFEYTDFEAVRTLELEHGRLAMVGFIGTMAGEYVTGYDAVDQWTHLTEAIRGVAR